MKEQERKDREWMQLALDLAGRGEEMCIRDRYSSAVTDVLVDGSSAEGEKDYSGNYTIPGEKFAQAGSYTITIRADGYKDKVFTVNIGDDALPVPGYVKADQSEIEIRCV